VQYSPVVIQFNPILSEIYIETQSGPPATLEMNIQTYALLSSLIAGLATTLGSLVVWWFDKDVRPKHLAFVLGLAASVMITVSIIDLLPPSYHELGVILTTIYFFIGVVIFMLLEKLIPDEDSKILRALFPVPDTPSSHSSQETSTFRNIEDPKAAHVMSITQRKSKFRLAMVMLMTLTLHNFPEGCAVAVTSLDDAQLGLITTFAIAMHNIPEGLAIAVPIYDSTGRRDLAVFYTLISGLSEPLGAFVTIYFIIPLFGMNQQLLHVVECVVAGIMTAVSFLELLPEATKQAAPNAKNFGILIGIVVMGACNYYV